MSSGFSSDAAAAAYKSLYLQSCESDFIVVGLQAGEVEGTPIRVFCTLITVSIVSSWFSQRKVKRLLLFFSHWLSGLVHQVSAMIMSMMVSLCWSQTGAEKAIKTLKFLEMAGANMLAVTNLGICVNLALIVSSHHTMSRVKSVSTPKVVMAFLLISLAATAAAVPFWDNIAVSGTLYWPNSPASEFRQQWVSISSWALELLVGVCMLVVVSLLLVFRWRELKECWKIHRRIRFYFGLTVIAIVVDLALGVGGVVYVVNDRKWQLVVSASWAARHIHIALDTLVLYGALSGNPRGMDERAGGARSSEGGNGSVSSSKSKTSSSKSKTSGGFVGGNATFGNGNSHRKVHSSHSSSTCV